MRPQSIVTPRTGENNIPNTQLNEISIPLNSDEAWSAGRHCMQSPISQGNTPNKNSSSPGCSGSAMHKRRRSIPCVRLPCKDLSSSYEGLQLSPSHSPAYSKPRNGNNGNNTPNCGLSGSRGDSVSRRFILSAQPSPVVTPHEDEEGGRGSFFDSPTVAKLAGVSGLLDDGVGIFESAPTAPKLETVLPLSCRNRLRRGAVVYNAGLTLAEMVEKLRVECEPCEA